jgi:D-alanyl-D-alanine carboxypeptidase
MPSPRFPITPLLALLATACAVTTTSGTTTTTTAVGATTTGAPPAGAAARDTAALHRRLQAVLDSARAAGSFPGATAGVALGDGTTIALATGLADTARREAMRPDHLLLAGSVGKTFAAAVALQLVQEGKLDLDAKVSRYLGGEAWFAAVPNAADVTVRMLMNHTSGIVRYEFGDRFLSDLKRDPYRTWTPEARLAYLAGTAAPFAAGQGWDYSDTNYILLGVIIERLTGRAFYDEMRARLVEPLALRGVVAADHPEIRGLAQGYAGPDNFFGGWDAMIGADGRLVMNPQMEWTGGGVATTAADLARWAHHLYAGRVLGEAIRAQMLAGVPARLGPDVRYGLGVILRPTPLGATYGHSGFFPGYSTDVMYFPDHGVAVAVQVNTSARGRTPRTGAMLVALARAAVGG